MLPHNLTGDISMARANGPALHQYACLRCRARRVKCDKILSGCANCAGHEAQCIYSARRPRKPQKAHQDQQAAQRTLLPSLVTPSSIHSTVTSRADSLGSELVSDHHSGTSEQSDDDDEDAFLLRELRDTGFQPREDATKTSLGRLLVGPNGESHYIDGEKIQQVAYLETVLAAESPDIKEGAPRTPRRRTEKLDADSLLNASFDGRDLRLYHPPSGSMHALWDFYCRNVDCMAKVLYKPDVKDLITRAATNLSSIDSSTEAPLLFAIWLAATLTMSADECRSVHRKDKASLIRKYRYAFEQSLVQARWMSTQNIMILQSLSIFLIFASESSRSTWILNGIALSLAQAMGMHSDSSAFSLSTTETEVRRRVYWMLYDTDVRVSEMCGLQSHIPFYMDTELPSHVNDSDIESSHTRPLRPRDEFTEMTLSLGKMEMARTVQLFKRSPLPREEKEQIVHSQLHRFESIYLKYFEGDNELHRLYYLGTRLMMNRLQQIVHGSAVDEPQTEESQTRQIIYNTDVLEMAYQLPSRYRQYGWFFRCKDTQWHAVAYLLLQLCERTKGPAVDRAWEVVDAAFAEWDKAILRKFNESRNSNQGAIASLWQPLLKLLERAREARQRDSQPRQESVPVGTPSTLSTGYDMSNFTSEDTCYSVHSNDVLIGDPFFGSAEDLNMEMNWDQLDTWVQNFQDGLLEQTTSIQDKELIGAMNWW